MGIFVLFTLVTIHLTERQAFGAYTFDRDVSRVIGIGPPKRWLVFMELRIQRCVGFYQLSAIQENKLIGVFRCLSILQRPPKRCYYSRNSSYYYLIISDDMLQFKYFETAIPHENCQKKTAVDVHILVYNSFHINFTVTSFAMPHLCRAQCYKDDSIFIVSFGIDFEEICGTRYPWRIYIPVNRAEVCIRGMSDNAFANIIGEVEVMDRQFILRLQGSHIEDLISWRHFKIYKYFITVEMLFRIRLSAITGSKVIIYDGPRLQMPQLSPYENVFNRSHYISSTFQVVIVYVSIDEHFISDVTYYNDVYFIPIKLIAPAHIILINNSGCGNTSILSWMCTFNIISLKRAQTNVEIMWLYISGPFANTHMSAGVAVYNVVNNTAYLVVHLFNNYNVDLRHKPISITGSENELYISVYAYSPYTLMSLMFIARVNPCIGIFIGKIVRPSLATIPQFTKTEYIGNQFHVNVNVTLDISSQCYITHINFLQTEPIHFHYTFHSHFKKCNFLRLLYNTFDGGKSNASLLIWGEFEITGGNRPRTFHQFIGDICQFAIILRYPRIASHFAATINATQLECLQPCGFRHIARFIAGRFLDMCNMCKYMWLEFLQCRYFMTKANEFITLERILGNQPLFFWSNSLSWRFPVRYESYYSMQDFIFRTPSSRRLKACFIKPGELWRIQRASLVMHEENVIDRKPPRMNIYQYKGEYEYISVVVQQDVYDEPTNITDYWLFYGIQCSKYDATFLTIHDYQELHFIVESIMQPFLIERVYISKSHMYQVWFLTEMNSHLIVILNEYIYVDLYWWVNLH